MAERRRAEWWSRGASCGTAASEPCNRSVMAGQRPSSASSAPSTPATCPIPPRLARPVRPSSGGGSRNDSRQFVVPERRRRKNPNKTPGPGTYDVGGLSRYTGGSSPRSPGWGFGTAKRLSPSTQNSARTRTPGPGSYEVRGKSRRGDGWQAWTPNSFSFPGQPNRPSPSKVSNSPGPRYYPEYQRFPDYTSAPRYSMDRTAHAPLSSPTVSPGPAHVNLRNGRVGKKVVAIGDVTHKTAQWTKCHEKLRTADERKDNVPGPATYTAVDKNKYSQNSEQAPSYSMGLKLSAPENAGRRKAPIEAGTDSVMYDVSAGAGGVLPNKANPRSYSFGRDDRFYDYE